MQAGNKCVGDHPDETGIIDWRKKRRKIIIQQTDVNNWPLCRSSEELCSFQSQEERGAPVPAVHLKEHLITDCLVESFPSKLKQGEDVLSVQWGCVLGCHEIEWIRMRTRGILFWPFAGFSSTTYLTGICWGYVWSCKKSQQQISWKLQKVLVVLQVFRRDGINQCRQDPCVPKWCYAPFWPQHLFLFSYLCNESVIWTRNGWFMKLKWGVINPILPACTM